MATSELVFKSAAELAPLLKSRKLSPVELVRACLDRIDAVNPKVNAFITVTADQALKQARRAEREIATGRYRGPLHGVPYAPKDLFATKGIRTTNGSKTSSNWTPDYESTVTARLNQAGAILIGKLNLVEFAMGSGRHGLAGPARNPWDLSYSPSGSSSGSVLRWPRAWFRSRSAAIPAAPFAIRPRAAVSWASSRPMGASAASA
jgi:aspartyl-tRNA(Asn)/glutamyl-tRNA(Gln) amidotransferase subunit A